jgi:hypothetical protein
VAACTSTTTSRKGCDQAQIVGRNEFVGGASYTANGVTLTGGQYTSGCGNNAGSDNAYRLYLWAGEELSVTMSPTKGGFTPRIGWYFVGASWTVPPGSCGTKLSCADATGSAPFTSSHSAAQTGWYVVVVGSNSYTKNDGEYNMSMSLQCSCGC